MKENFNRKFTWIIGLKTNKGIDLNPAEAKGWVAPILKEQGFEAFTLREVDGYWCGVPEKSLIVTVLLLASPEPTPNSAPENFGLSLAQKFAAKFEQDCVLFEAANVRGFLVSNDGTSYGAAEKIAGEDQKGLGSALSDTEKQYWSKYQG